jgi:tetratricopeptide (TPR) repeat protein
MAVQAARQTEADALIEKLLALPDATARKSLVAQHPQAAWDDIVRTLTEKVWQEVRVDTHRAERVAQAAIDVAEVLGHPASLALAFRARANALYTLDHHAEAIEFHEKAIALFEQVGDQAELARTLSGSIQPLLLLGRYDEALAAGERARKIFDAHGNKRRLARLDINIGNIYHRQDRFREAVQFYQRAYDELLQHDDAEGLAAVLRTIFPGRSSCTALPASIASARECPSWSPTPTTTLRTSIFYAGNLGGQSKCCAMPL